MISPKLQGLVNQLLNLNPAELSELKAAVNEQLKNHLRDISVGGPLTDDEWLSLDNNNRLSCIKSVRDRTGLGLVDASAYVNRARAKRRTAGDNPDHTLAPAATPLLEDSGAGLQRGTEGHTLYCPRGCCDTEQDFGNRGRRDGERGHRGPRGPQGPAAPLVPFVPPFPAVVPTINQHPPGKWPPKGPWEGYPPNACQWCASTRLNFQHYGCNYAWCANCHRQSVPVSASACWAAMRLVRGMRGNAQTWDPLGDMVDQLSSSKATAARQDPDLKLPGLSHAECLALRALTHCDQDGPLAITLLQEWAANICDRKPDDDC